MRDGRGPHAAAALGTAGRFGPLGASP